MSETNDNGHTFVLADFWRELAHWKECEPEELCEACQATGQKGYPNTTAWHGGIGGQMVTSAVCDECWGSGIRTRPGANLKRIDAEQRALRARLAAAEARAEELLLLYGEEHERAERLAAYVRASEQLRHAEIMLGNSEDHTSQSRTWSYAVMEADCKLIAARGEFQPGDLGEL